MRCQREPINKTRLLIPDPPLIASRRVRKYQRQSQEKSPDSLLIASRSCQSQEKSPDPLLNRFRKTSFADSENTPTMQSQKNFLRRVRKTFFTDSRKPSSPSQKNLLHRVRKTTFRKSQENRLWSLSWWLLLLTLSEQNYPEGTFNDSASSRVILP